MTVSQSFAFLVGAALSTAAVLPRPSLAGIPQAEALGKMVDDAYRYGSQAAFVFDLDETTVDSTPRRYESLLDAIDEACAPRSTPDCAAARTITLGDLYRLRNRYDIVTSLRHAGVHDEALAKTLDDRAFAIYLSGRYIVEKDRLYVGAKAFLRELKKAGARVYYVSSRSIETQRKPTLTFLKEHGILEDGEESLLYVKPDAEKSPDFKRRATLEIAERVANGGGRVFGIFENEPENLEIWMENFPRAMSFFMVGAYQHEGPVANRAVILEDFRY